MICMSFQGKDYEQHIKNISKVTFRGTYQIGGEIKPISENNMLEVGLHQQVVLRGRFSKYIPPGKEMFFYMYRMRMTIKQNGEKIYSYGQAGFYPTPVKSIGTDWAKFVSKGIKIEDEIEIILEPTYDEINSGAYTNFLNNIYAGDRFAFLRQEIRKNILSIAIGFITFILGSIFLAAMNVLKFTKAPVLQGYNSCGLLIMTGAVCTLVNYRYITVVFNNSFMVNILDFLMQIVICELFMVYLMNYLITEKYLQICRALMKLVIGFMIVYLVLQLIGLMDILQMLEILLITMIVVLLLMLFFLARDYSKWVEWEIRKILVAIFILGTTALIEIVHYLRTNVYWTFIFQIGLLSFTIIQMGIVLHYTKENIEKAKRTEAVEKELIQNRIAIMMSQIQPHFLYNALTSIQELCLCDPERAHTVLIKFSQFLRGNMDSLKTSELIPFDKELEHVKNYLYLEKMRYNEYLEIEYEIKVSDFLLPALSIQPIVENAVRYGVGKKEEGGRVAIRTYDTEAYYKITIEDDGVGFIVENMEKGIEQDLRRSHIGLKNVENRLRAQCDGQLKVESQLGVGTKVIILIPKKRGER